MPIEISETPLCAYDKLVNFQVTKDGQLMDPTFLSIENHNTAELAIESDDVLDVGTYIISLTVS